MVSLRKSILLALVGSVLLAAALANDVVQQQQDQATGAATEAVNGATDFVQRAGDLAKNTVAGFYGLGSKLWNSVKRNAASVSSPFSHNGSRGGAPKEQKQAEPATEVGQQQEQAETVTEAGQQQEQKQADVGQQQEQEPETVTEAGQQQEQKQADVGQQQEQEPETVTEVGQQQEQKQADAGQEQQAQQPAADQSNKV